MRAVHILRTEHRIITLCKVLMVNRSSYYKHYCSKDAPRVAENKEIRKIILRIWIDYKKRYGVKKTNIILLSEYGIKISDGRVYRLMKSMELPKMSTQKAKNDQKSKQNIIEANSKNILKQQFKQNKLNIAWAGDITYLKVNSQNYYLCIIMDLFSRKIISWKLSKSIDAKLVCDTFKKAVQKRNPQNGLIFSF